VTWGSGVKRLRGKKHPCVLHRSSRLARRIYPHHPGEGRRKNAEPHLLEGVARTECHVSTGCGSPQRARWLLISLSPGLHELRRANDRALAPALGWIVGQVACDEIIHLPSQSETEHHLHFRRRARRAAAISASISDRVKPVVPLAAAACCSATCTWSARALRKSERVDSADAAAMRRSTATGRPLEVMIKSALPADFNHWLAGCFFSSLTEIVLTAAIHKNCAAHARRQAK